LLEGTIPMCVACHGPSVPLTATNDWGNPLPQ
jgi:hypothetical protein